MNPMRLLLLCVATMLLSACGAVSSLSDAGFLLDSGVQSTTDAGFAADAGMSTDAGPGAIVAPAETWTWVDFSASRCGNGAPTGIAVNPSTQSTDVFIYLEGGGACWESLTCFVIRSADHFESGYTSATYANDPSASLPAFRRNVAANPFKKASFVFVPYCTGDVHSGDAVKTIDGRTVHFKGAANLELYLQRLRLTFPSATRVFLTGSSAGAFGAQLNYQRVRDAFPLAEVHVLADSGQMVNPRGTRLQDWVLMWNVTVPATCTDCLTSYPKYLHWLIVNHPTSRIALLAFSQDQVLRRFFDYTGPEYQTQTELLLSAQYDPNANARYFYVLNDGHTMLGSQFAASARPLNDFITQWAEGSASWANVKQ